MTDGIKHDGGKVQPVLVLETMARALQAVCEVGTFGAQKYSADNWLQVADASSRYRNAKHRHMLAAATGETHDPESGLLHAAHEAWNALAVLELQLRGHIEHGCKMVSTKHSVWKPEVVYAVALPEIDWSGAPWGATHAKAPHASGPIEFIKQLPARWQGWIDGRWQHISVNDLPYLMVVRPEPDWDKGEARIDRIAASAGDGEHYDVLMLPEDFLVPEGLRFISVLDNGQAVGHVNKPILIDNGGELCWNPQGENVYLGLLDSGFGLYEFIGDHWILTEAAA